MARFLKPELDKARVQVAAAKTALGARRWSEAVMAGVTAVRALVGDRADGAPARLLRDGTDRDRRRRSPRSRPTRPSPTAARGLDALLAEADASASRDAMQFEAGEAKLRDINTRCDMIMAAAADTEAYKQQKPPADAELAALDKHAGRGPRRGGARDGAQAA